MFNNVKDSKEAVNVSSKLWVRYISLENRMKIQGHKTGVQCYKHEFHKQILFPTVLDEK